MKTETVRYSSCFRFFLLLATIAICFASAFAASDDHPCAADPESRQLDYWLGTWSVSAPGSAKNAVSSVTLALDQCLVVESWDGGRGHVGENLMAYSPEEKSWYGLFADNKGRVHIFTQGKIASGVAEFQGPSHGPKGEIILNKVTVVRIDANKVEQTWQKSTDNGVTWTTEFRGEYTRTNP